MYFVVKLIKKKIIGIIILGCTTKNNSQTQKLRRIKSQQTRVTHIFAYIES